MTQTTRRDLIEALFSLAAISVLPGKAIAQTVQTHKKKPVAAPAPAAAAPAAPIERFTPPHAPRLTPDDVTVMLGSKAYSDEYTQAALGYIKPVSDPQLLAWDPAPAKQAEWVNAAGGYFKAYAKSLRDLSVAGAIGMNSVSTQAEADKAYKRDARLVQAQAQATVDGSAALNTMLGRLQIKPFLIQAGAPDLAAKLEPMDLEAVTKAAKSGDPTAIATRLAQLIDLIDATGEAITKSVTVPGAVTPPPPPKKKGFLGALEDGAKSGLAKATTKPNQPPAKPMFWNAQTAETVAAATGVLHPAEKRLENIVGADRFFNADGTVKAAAPTLTALPRPVGTPEATSQP